MNGNNLQVVLLQIHKFARVNLRRCADKQKVNSCSVWGSFAFLTRPIGQFAVNRIKEGG